MCAYLPKSCHSTQFGSYDSNKHVPNLIFSKWLLKIQERFFEKRLFSLPDTIKLKFLINEQICIYAIKSKKE